MTQGKKQIDCIIFRSDINNDLGGKSWSFQSVKSDQSLVNFNVKYITKEEIPSKYTFTTTSDSNGSLAGKFFTLSNDTEKFCVWFKCINNNPIQETAIFRAVNDVNGSLAGKFFTFSSDTNKYLVYFIVNSTGQFEETTITCTQDTNKSLNSKYFLFNSINSGYYCWFDVDNSGENPNIQGRKPIKIPIESNSSASTIRDSIIEAINNENIPNLEVLPINNDTLKIKVTEAVDVLDSRSGNTGFSFFIKQGKQSKGKKPSIDIVFQNTNLDKSYFEFSFDKKCVVFYRLNSNDTFQGEYDEIFYIDITTDDTIEILTSKTINALSSQYLIQQDTYNAFKLIIKDTQYREIQQPQGFGNITVYLNQGMSNKLGVKPDINEYTPIKIEINEDSTAEEIVSILLSSINLNDITLEPIYEDSRAFRIKSNAYVNIEKASSGNSGFSLQIIEGAKPEIGVKPNGFDDYIDICCEIPINATNTQIAQAIKNLNINKFDITCLNNQVQFLATEAFLNLESFNTQNSGFLLITKIDGEIKYYGKEDPSDTTVNVLLFKNDSAETVASKTYTELQNNASKLFSSFALSGKSITISREYEGETKINIGNCGFTFATLVKGAFPIKTKSDLWKKQNVKIPLLNNINSIKPKIETTKNTVKGLLETSKTLLEAAQLFYSNTIDPFKAVTLALITMLENTIKDFYDTGFYYIVISPFDAEARKTFYMGELENQKNKLFELEEKIRDEKIKRNKTKFTHFYKESLLQKAKILTTQAFANISFDGGFPALLPSEAIQLVIESLDDEGDEKRPIIRQTTNTAALGFMITTTSPEDFYNMLIAFLNVFSVDYLEELKQNTEIAKNTAENIKQCSKLPDWGSYKLSDNAFLLKTRDVLLDLLETCRGYTITADEALKNLISIIESKLQILEDLVKKLEELEKLANFTSNVHVFSMPRTTGKDRLIENLTSSEELNNSKASCTCFILFLGTDQTVTLIEKLQKLLLGS